MRRKRDFTPIVIDTAFADVSLELRGLSIARISITPEQDRERQQIVGADGNQKVRQVTQLVVLFFRHESENILHEGSVIAVGLLIGVVDLFVAPPP